MKIGAIAFAVVGLFVAPTPPPPPTGVGAAAGTGQVTISWTANNPPVSGYNIYRAGVSGGPYTKVNGSLDTASPYVNTGLTSGTPYFFVVRAVNASQEESANSAEVTKVPLGTDVTAPAPPIITSASRKTRDSTPSTSGTAEPATTVRVYSGAAQIGSTTAAPNGTWTVANPSALGSDGVYTITAKATDAASNQSAASSAILITLDTTVPASPTNVFTTAYHNCVDVEWTASVSSDLAGYKIERKTGAGSWGVLNSNLVIGTKYRDTTAVNGTTYTYRVTAVDDALDY